MNILSQDLASKIWHCHREIDNAQRLLEELEKNKDRISCKDEPTLADAYGRKRHFEFGIPSGENSRRLYQVSPELSVYVITAHLAEKKKELVEHCVKARMELDGVLDGATAQLQQDSGTA